MDYKLKKGVLLFTIMFIVCFLFVPAVSLAEDAAEPVENSSVETAANPAQPSAEPSQTETPAPSMSVLPEAENSLPLQQPQTFAADAEAPAPVSAGQTIIGLFPDAAFAETIRRELYKSSVSDVVTQNDLDGITELMLPGDLLDLTGIGNLVNLESLSIENNPNLQILPAEIGSLTNLEKLDVTNCALDTLPAEIGSLVNLRQLNLQNNFLTSLPEEMKNLSSLQELDLLGNSMEDFPVAACEIPHLKKLVLSENSIKNLPAEIGNMAELEAIWLESNQIEKLPQEIGKLKNLQTFVLRDNNITSVPEEFGELESLQGINLENNLLEWVPNAILKPAGLTYINLNENYLTSLPGGIGDLEYLEQLNVYDNELTELPEELCDSPNLNAISAGKNRIEELPWEIWKLQKLLSLNMEENGLWYLPDEIGALSELRTLNVDDNQLMELPSTIGNLKKCYQISANRNDLAYLPEEIADMPQLDKLFVSGNHLADVSMVPQRVTYFEAHNQNVIINSYKKDITFPCTFAVGGTILWDRGVQENEVKSNDFYKNGTFHLKTNPAGGKLESKSGNFSINYTIDLRDKLFVDLGIDQINLSPGEVYTLAPISDVLDGYEVEYTCTSSDGWKAAGFLAPDAVIGIKEGTSYVTVKGTVKDTGITGEATIPVFVSPEKPKLKGTNYPFLEGGGQTLSGDMKELGFRIDAPIGKFVNAWIGETKLLRELDYTLQDGSTIILLKEPALRELADGVHTLSVEFEDGYAQMEFTVDRAVGEEKKAAPKTGDKEEWPFIILALVSVLVLVLAWPFALTLLFETDTIKRVEMTPKKRK